MAGTQWPAIAATDAGGCRRRASEQNPAAASDAATSANKPTKDIRKQIVDRHALALELWETGIHEARIVAYLIDDPKLVTEEQMDAWAGDFDNWAITDGTWGGSLAEYATAFATGFAGEAVAWRRFPLFRGKRGEQVESEPPPAPTTRPVPAGGD